MSTDQPPLTPDLYARIHDLPRPDHRAHLHAMFNLSEAGETEFTARADAVVAAETAMLQARIDELEAQRASVLSLHQQHSDSAHCTADGEWWPCSTRNALGADVEYGLLLPAQDDDHPAVIVGTTYDRAEAERGLRDWSDAGHVLMMLVPGSCKWTAVPTS